MGTCQLLENPASCYRRAALHAAAHASCLRVLRHPLRLVSLHAAPASRARASGPLLRSASLRCPQQAQAGLRRRARRCAASAGSSEAPASPSQLDAQPQPAPAALDQQREATQSSSQPVAGSQRRQWQLASAARGGWAPRLSALLLGVGGGLGSLLGGADLQGPESVAGAAAVLAAIIAIHEAGHFAAARLQGIHVSKFSIGFGPALFKYQGPEVEYSLRLIPLGGYVGFPDEEAEEAADQAAAAGKDAAAAAEAAAAVLKKYPADDPDLLKNRPIKDRAIVISAGVIANIIFAFSVLTAQVSTVGLTRTAFSPGVLVPEVTAASPAEAAGMRPKDVLVSVAGTPIGPAARAVPEAIKRIKASPGQALLMEVLRGGERVELAVTPDAAGRIGVQLAANLRLLHQQAASPAQALGMAAGEFARLTKVVFGGLAALVFDFARSSEQVSGPLAIVAAGAEVSRADAAGLYQFAAIININLAVVNLLPLPALDGGYLALLALEAVRGRKLPPGVEQGIMASGFLLLTGVGLALLVKDTLSLSGV